MEKAEYVYRFDARGCRFYVCACCIDEALMQIHMFDVRTLKKPKSYRPPRVVTRRALSQIARRVPYRDEMWYLKGDGPERYWPYSCSPLPIHELYRRFRSICPAQY